MRLKCCKWNIAFTVTGILKQRGCLFVWGKFLDPSPQSKEDVSYRLRFLPHLMSISSVSDSNFTSLWAVVDNWMKINRRGLHAHIENDSPTHTLYCWSSEPVSIWYGCKTSIVLFPGRRCCSWSFQPTDFDRRPWWERSIPFSRSKRNGGQYRENWDMCLSLSKRIHSLASAWRKAVSIHQALKEAGAFFWSCLEREENCILWEKRKDSAQTFYQRDWFLWQVIRDNVWCTC